MSKKDNKKIEKIKKLIDDGEIDKALEIADANIIESLFELGNSFLISRKYNIAEKIFNRIIQLNPKLAGAWSNKGAALGILEKYDEAIKCFDEALKINPNIFATWNNKAQALVNLGKYADAITSFSKALEISPNDDAAWYNQGIALGKLGKYDEAIKSFDKALKINPNYDVAWYNKGLSFGHLGKNDEAIKSFDEALKINSNNDEAWLNKGVALVNLVKYAEAIKCYDESLKINPNDDKAWRNKGVALGTIGKHVEAFKSFNEALKINPNDNEAWLNKGVALTNLGKYDEAIKCYNKAIKINLHYDLAWYNKGVAIGELGKYDEAIKCYDETIKINPSYVNAWLNKGVALVNIGKHDEAIKSYDQALKLNPDYYKTWSNKGVALVSLGKHYEAIKCFGEALKINPNYSEAHANLGITLLNIHEYDNAATELRKAKKLFSKIGLKEDAEKVHRYELWAINASELISNIKPLDEHFISALNSRSMNELKDKSLEISKGIESIIKEFEGKEIPHDVNELLVSKAICFTSLSNALKFEKVDLEELGNTKKIFEKWGFEKFVTAVNSLDTFIRRLNKYNNLDEIPKQEEDRLLQVLIILHILNGKLTEEITDKIKGEPPYTAKPEIMLTEKQPEIKYLYIANSEKEWVKFCLVQLDFSLKPNPPSEEFGYILDELDKIKNKVLKALDIANKNKMDIICFPELSFAKDWVEEIRNKYKEMIIIGGSYYDEGYNVCPIIIDGEYIDPPYKKCCPSPIENPETTGRGMKSGNIIYILQTKCGRFSVLTCIDYTDQSYRVCRYEGKGVDFIINPSYNENIFRFQHRCNSDCEDYNINVIQMNKAPDGSKYGGTCIIGKEHDTTLQRLKEDEFKPEDDIKYKLFQLDGEMMIIADLNIRMKAPPVSLPIDYAGRISIKKCYKYENEIWVPLSN